MATTRDPLEPILAELRDAARRSRRASLRRQANSYLRDGRILLYWCLPPSRAAVQAALADPGDAAVTRRLCRALWRDLRSAEALPRYLSGRAMRIGSLRLLFAGECALLLRQRSATGVAKPPAGPERAPTTGDWLTGLCRAIEAVPAAPRARQRPRGAAGAYAPITAERSRGPAGGTGNTRRRTRPVPP